MLFEITIRIPLGIVQEVTGPLLYFWRLLIYSQNHWLKYIFVNITAIITVIQYLIVPSIRRDLPCLDSQLAIIDLEIFANWTSTKQKPDMRTKEKCV